jgi:hypothetical protein
MVEANTTNRNSMIWINHVQFCYFNEYISVGATLAQTDRCLTEFVWIYFFF